MRTVDGREDGTDEKLAQLRCEDCILGRTISAEMRRHDERRRSISKAKVVPTDRTESAGE